MIRAGRQRIFRPDPRPREWRRASRGRLSVVLIIVVGLAVLAAIALPAILMARSEDSGEGPAILRDVTRDHSWPRTWVNRYDNVVEINTESSHCYVLYHYDDPVSLHCSPLSK